MPLPQKNATERFCQTQSSNIIDQEAYENEQPVLV